MKAKLASSAVVALSALVGCGSAPHEGSGASPRRKCDRHDEMSGMSRFAAVVSVVSDLGFQPSQGSVQT